MDLYRAFVHPVTYFAGGWYRTGRVGSCNMAMGFYGRGRAETYGLRGLDSADPYVRHLTGPLRWEPGVLFRRSPAAYEIPLRRQP